MDLRNTRQDIGKQGEEATAKYLENLGCIILERNLKKPWGEIDIVAKRKRVVHFVEVKSRGRQSNPMFYPEDNITPEQKRRLLNAARLYLAKKKYPPEQEYQIDLAAVELGDGEEPTIRYYERAITE